MSNASPASTERPRALRFEGVEIDIAAGRVWRMGVEQSLAPQPMRLLVYLAERAGQLVERDELRSALWSDQHLEFDQALNFAVRQIRRALHDSAHTPRLIETVPRRGYRFVARPATSVSAPQQSAWRHRRPKTVTGLLLATCSIAAIVASAWPAIHVRPALHAQPVAPLLVSVSVTAARSADQPMARTITRDIASALAQLDGLRVSSSPDSGVRVGLILEPFGSDTRVVASLVWPGEPRPRWRAVVTVPSRDVPQDLRRLPRDIATDIARVLRNAGDGKQSAGRIETVVVEPSDMTSSQRHRLPGATGGAIAGRE